MSFATKCERFSDEEKTVLINLVLQKKSIVECKKSDVISVKKKQEAWKEIETNFNSNANVNKRSWSQLKKFWCNMKQKRKKQLAAEARHTYGGTGGGPYIPPTPTIPELELAIPSIVLNVSGAIDSDTFPETQETEGPSETQSTNFDEVFSNGINQNDEDSDTETMYNGSQGDIENSQLAEAQSSALAFSSRHSIFSSQSFSNHSESILPSPVIQNHSVFPSEPFTNQSESILSSSVLKNHSGISRKSKQSAVLTSTPLNNITNKENILPVSSTSRSTISNDTPLRKRISTPSTSSSAPLQTAPNIVNTPSRNNQSAPSLTQRSRNAVDRELDARLSRVKAAQDRESQLMVYQQIEHEQRLKFQRIANRNELLKRRFLIEREKREKEAYEKEEQRKQQAFEEEEKRKKILFELQKNKLSNK